MFEGNLTRREIMVKLEEALKSHRTIKRAIPSISDIFSESGRSFSPKDYRLFTHKIGNHRWQGIIYQVRNSLMGCCLSYWDTKACLITGYPKIKYAEESRVLDKEVITEYKIDGCYDKDTELLTENGWKKFEDLIIGELLFTRNNLGEIDLQPCEQVISLDYDGILHHYQMKNLDLKVTPDHWNFVSLVHKPKNFRTRIHDEPQRIQSKDMKNKWCIFYSDGIWKGKEEIFFKIGSRKFQMNLWLKFLGYWLTDGTKNSHKTSDE